MIPIYLWDPKVSKLSWRSAMLPSWSSIPFVMLLSVIKSNCLHLSGLKEGRWDRSLWCGSEISQGYAHSRYIIGCYPFTGSMVPPLWSIHFQSWWSDEGGSGVCRTVELLHEKFLRSTKATLGFWGHGFLLFFLNEFSFCVSSSYLCLISFLTL